MTLFDDDRPKKIPPHEVGADLSLLSVEELDARIAILKTEIARLETERSAKEKSRGAAESLFR